MRTLPLLAAMGRRPWFERRLPPALLEEGPRGLLWWQVLAIPVLVFLAWLGGRTLGWLTRKVLGHLFARTTTTWDDLLLERLTAPLTAFWSIWIAWALLPSLALGDGAHASVEGALRAASLVVLFWAALRSVDIGFKAIASFPFARANPLAAGMLPLGSRIARVVVVIMGVIAVLTQLGYPVASLLAGLGIGGLAVALAAQKTFENLLGSVAISVDQPCRVGDFVRVDGGVMGTVETIGLRSTRLRTLDRMLVTIPNGKLSDSRIESFAARDQMRLFVVLPLVYSTRADQVRAIIAGLEQLLRGHPKVVADSVSVRFVNLGQSSLDVEVVAMFDTPDWAAFTAMRQELYLGFMDVVERAGTSFAFPTQTVHVASLPAPAARDGERSGRA